MKLKELAGPEVKKAAVSALRKSANILAKETDKQFRGHINIGKARVDTITRKNGKSVRKIRRISTVKVSRQDLSAKVHILSDFRIKFFEMGTRERRTKGYKIVGSYRKGKRKYLIREGKGRRTGRISAGWYFLKAQQLTERQVFDSIETNLSQAIEKIWNKKNK